jgi:carbamoyltransferase
MIDGKLIACISEERYSRQKNDMVFPKHAIEFCLRKGGLQGSELDRVAIGSEHIPADYQITKHFSSFSTRDYLRSQYEYWKPKLLEGKNPRWVDVFKDKIDMNQYPGGWEAIDFTSPEMQWRTYKPFIHDAIVRLTGIAKDRIVHVYHHSAHAHYAYYGSPFRKKPCLVFTMDAYGDGISASISVVKNDKLEMVAKSDAFFIGRLYRYITLLLGMKPNEHEYKVMGLAPYAKNAYIKAPYEVFAKTMYVDDLDFKYHEKPSDLFFYFKDRLEGYRFDAIAGALQKYTEDILTQWVFNAVRHFGIGRAVFSGGVALNIKALKTVGEIEILTELFCCPGGGDESIGVGACYHVEAKDIVKRGESLDAVQPLETAYLGESTDGQAADFIQKNGYDKKYAAFSNVPPRQVAEQLAKGKVIARSAGRCEFGPRALGNRSIMADPRDFGMIAKINEKIKNRDFWMPFTPSILAERESDYLINPKKFPAPFMTVAFDTTPLAQAHFPAALHPYDKTARPQLVTAKSNPGYYAIIKEFEAITGVGAILNTSFNLHGEPIAQSLSDSMHVFEDSDIDGILLGDHLLLKK